MDKETLKGYDDIFKLQMSDGIIEEVRYTPAPKMEGPVHYLPHHGVRTKRQKNKNKKRRN